VPLESNGELKLTNSASEKVFVIGARNGLQRRSGIFLNPATGALEITPGLRLKARKALLREARRMNLRLKLRLADLYIRKFLLGIQSARVKVVGYLDRQLHQIVSCCHGLILPPLDK